MKNGNKTKTAYTFKTGKLQIYMDCRCKFPKNTFQMLNNKKNVLKKKY